MASLDIYKKVIPESTDEALLETFKMYSDLAEKERGLIELWTKRPLRDCFKRISSEKILLRYVSIMDLVVSEQIKRGSKVIND